jgi:hypothetical protein
MVLSVNRDYFLNPLKPKVIVKYFKIRSLPQRKHNTFDYKDQLVNAVQGNNRCSEDLTKLIYTLCGQNVALPIVKSGGKYSYHLALKG